MPKKANIDYTEEQLLSAIKDILDEHIVKYGMNNGYNTSFGDQHIRNRVQSGFDLMICKDEVTIKELRHIGYKLYESLYVICYNYQPFRDEKVTIRIYSVHEEHGCYRHFVQIVNEPIDIRYYNIFKKGKRK